MQLETMYSRVDGPVATVALNRPDVLNCANEQWARDLNTLVDDLSANAGVRVVIVRGEGRAFCSGIDLTALSQGEISMDFFRNWEAALRKIEAMNPIVIAAIWQAGARRGGRPPPSISDQVLDRRERVGGRVSAGNDHTLDR